MNNLHGIAASLLFFVVATTGLSAQILSVTPDTAEQNQTLNIAVTAQGVDFTQGSNIVNFKQGNTTVTASSTTINSSTSLTLNCSFINHEPVGYYDLSIWNTFSNSTVTKDSALYLKPDPTLARIDSITPDTGRQGELVTITLFCTNANFTADSTSNAVYLINGYKVMDAQSIHVINDTTLEAQFEPTYAYPTGSYTINAFDNSDGNIIISNAFELLQGPNPPSVKTVTPDTIVQGSGQINIDVTGQNVDFTQGTNLVFLKNGSTISFPYTLTVKSQTSLTLNTFFNINYPVGYYDLSILNSSTDVTINKDSAFYLLPDPTVASIDSISTSVCHQGDEVTVRIYGNNTNFDNKGITNLVYLKGAVEIVADTVYAIDPVTLEAHFNIGYGDTPGWYSINIYNDLDGGIYQDNAMEILKGSNSPSIVSVTPDTAMPGQSLNIAVTAKNIDFTQGSNIVSFTQGSTTLDAGKTSVESATSLTANYSFTHNEPQGYYDLSIWNTFTNITMTKDSALYLMPNSTLAWIDSITPGTVNQGDEVTIKIYGTNTNFDKTGITNLVYLGGSVQINADSVHAIDSVTLEAQFTISYNDQPGVYSIYVYNSQDGNIHLSNALEILQKNPPPVIDSVTPDTVMQGQSTDIQIIAENVDFTILANVVFLEQGNTQIYADTSIALAPNKLKTYLTIDANASVGAYNLVIYNLTNGTLTKDNAIFIKSKTTKGINYVSDQMMSYFYPNPARNVIYLKNKYESIELMDVNGREILSTGNVNTINISGLQKGIYFIKLKKRDKLIIQKLIVQ